MRTLASVEFEIACYTSFQLPGQGLSILRKCAVCLPFRPFLLSSFHLFSALSLSLSSFTLFSFKVFFSVFAGLAQSLLGGVLPWTSPVQEPRMSECLNVKEKAE